MSGVWVPGSHPGSPLVSCVRGHKSVRLSSPQLSRYKAVGAGGTDGTTSVDTANTDILQSSET